ncbi:hypothetical protein WT83_27485 [Burkholderia territorii]|uniref:Uncharacterized protein n=1 Tax=Burkholderia territorii TaxID=1503055 RepID=A0A108E826_9BURK|nr:hypothetical protein [Burkholderia territorii]KWN06427.1 hypothetical protein WT83_27485 [Burkholderia territorii]
MDHTSKEITGLLLYSLGGIVLFVAVIACVVVTPYFVVRTGFAEWMFGQSTNHPLLVGGVLLLSGIMLLQVMRRLYRQR